MTGRDPTRYGAAERRADLGERLLELPVHQLHGQPEHAVPYRPFSEDAGRISRE